MINNIILVILFYILLIIKLNKKQIIQNEKFNNIELLNYNNKYIINTEQQQVKNKEEQKLYDLVSTFKDTCDYTILLHIGNIYQKGIYSIYKCNKEIASECYKMAARCHDPEISSIGQLKYIENYNDNINEDDNIGKEIPEIYGRELCIIAKDHIDNTPYNFFTIKPTNKTTTFEPITANADVYSYIPTQIIQRTFIDNDLQNVHDHSVSNIVKKNIDILKTSSRDNVSHQKIINDILENPYLSQTEKEKSLLVIDSLNDTTKHDTYDISELDALKLIENKISEVYDKTKKDNLIEILGKQLSSAIENGNIVCSTGKISRIVSTFDGIDQDFTSIRPITAIRLEISNLAVKYRDSKQDFINAVTNTYIKDLKLSPDIINNIINEYSEHM